MGKFTKDEEQLLKLFQSESNRRAEEEFARIFTENDTVRVAFINEDRAFTDGRNIVVDPAMDKLFSDEYAINNTLRVLGLPENSCSPWAALKLTTRAQDIHECLHIIYTKFPNPAATDKRSTTKARAMTLSMIGNVIEDAYIEAVGSSVYDNAEMYLKWGRISRMFVSQPSQGTVSRIFEESNVDSDEAVLLMYFINYMATDLLYPMADISEPIEECKEIIDKIKPLYMAGAAAASPMERHRYSCMIFDILEDFIPDSEEQIDRTYLDKITGGTETHSAFRCSPKQFVSDGKEMAVQRRLFTDLDGKRIDGKDILQQYIILSAEAECEYKEAEEEAEKSGTVIVLTGSDYGAAAIHSGIRIVQNHPKPNKNLSRAYQNILKQYRTSINKYNSRFERLLKAERECFEDKQLFGNGISSKNLCDVKKRYWYKKTVDEGIPDLAVLFMIDGSGSMWGERRNAALTSSVILHEVLSKQGIEHAFVEHRAIFYEPTVEHNVLVDFNGKDSEKYNLLALSAHQGTREGLSLFWAERYLAQKSIAQNKLIVVISDGLPAHQCDDNLYLPPASVMDTKNAAKKIVHRGTKIIAIALGGTEGSCYDELKQIYSQTIDCSDLKSLTGQLLKVISKELSR
ncbi:MAG: hypothetical protein ACI4J8_06550 [Oscillospiraceae bacterium]